MNDDKYAIINLENISKTYQTDTVMTHALNDVSLKIYDGEFVAILGRSGSGKSTLLSVLGLLEQPTGGLYKLDGVKTTNLSRGQLAKLRNRHIGFIFQAYNLINEMTVVDNVALPLKYRNIPKKTAREKALNLLERLDLSHRTDHLPQQLSGGEQQRVAIARALIGEPSLILADEPTGNLDTENGDRVMKILKEIHNTGVTICMVTHNPDETKYANRKIILEDGKIDVVG